MNRMIMALGVVVLPILITEKLYSVDSSASELLIFNESDTTVLITFTRFAAGAVRSKLLETNEVINFGRVYEASVQSYSTLWGYIAPGKQTIFSAQAFKKHNIFHDILVRIKGVTGRGLFHPFGQWDYQMEIGKQVEGMVPDGHVMLAEQSILDVFPTAKRKIMFTPRYILGLPAYASQDDAIEAAAMLENKWHHMVMNDYDEKFVANVIYLIEASRKEFEYGKGDVPLHVPIQMRSPGTTDDPHDLEALAWS